MRGWWPLALVCVGLTARALESETTWYQPALAYEAIPYGPEFRFQAEFGDEVDRNAFVRHVLSRHLGNISDQQFDMMSLLAPEDGLMGFLARGTKLGLVTGSAGYVLGVLTDAADPGTIGAVTLAGGFFAGALGYADGPSSFTLRCGEASACRLVLGWQEKPGYLPRAVPGFAGSGVNGSFTAGASLTFGGLDGGPAAALFWDPFAAGRSSLGGLSLTASF